MSRTFHIRGVSTDSSVGTWVAGRPTGIPDGGKGIPDGAGSRKNSQEVGPRTPLGSREEWPLVGSSREDVAGSAGSDSIRKQEASPRAWLCTAPPANESQAHGLSLDLSSAPQTLVTCALSIADSQPCPGALSTRLRAAQICASRLNRPLRLHLPAPEPVTHAASSGFAPWTVLSQLNSWGQ